MRSLYGRIFLSFWAVMIVVVAGSIGLTWLVLEERADAEGASFSVRGERKAIEALRDKLEQAQQAR